MLTIDIWSNKDVAEWQHHKQSTRHQRASRSLVAFSHTTSITMKAKPAVEIRFGLIVVRVWHKKTHSGLRHSVTLHRLFRNGDHWTESSRFGRDDIPVMRLALDKAHDWIMQNGTRAESDTKQTWPLHRHE